MLLLALLGFIAFYYSGADALSVDAAYSLINFASAMIARSVLRSSRAQPNYTAPYGQGSLENIYGFFRSLILVGVIGLAVIGAVVTLIDYFALGESEDIHLGVAGAYGLIAATILFLLSLNYRSVQARYPSGVLTAERNATVTDAVISFASGVVFLSLSVIPNDTFVTNSSFDIRSIADSILVIILAFMLLGEPWKKLRQEFNRISGIRQDEEIEASLFDLLHDTAGFDVCDIFVIDRGSFIETDIRVAYEGMKGVDQLDVMRLEIKELVQVHHAGARVHVIFTRSSIANSIKSSEISDS